jgi:hypothetical protein
MISVNMPMNKSTEHQLSKIELVPILVDVAVSWVNKYGEEKILKNLPGPVHMADRDRLSVIFMTPKSMACIYGGENYSVNVWLDGKKTFFVCWSSQRLKDYEVVNFKRGPWISMLTNDLQ